jgi:hypothetical protein
VDVHNQGRCAAARLLLLKMKVSMFFKAGRKGSIYAAPYRRLSVLSINNPPEPRATEEERGRCCVCMAKRQSPGTEGKSSKQDTDAAPSLAGSRAVVHAVIDGGLTGLMVLSEIESGEAIQVRRQKKIYEGLN